MADDLKRVGLKLTADGAQDFKAALKDCTAATKENYSELKLAQSQYDKNTTSVQKLQDRQKYLQSQTEVYTDKVAILNRQLEAMENAENKDEAAISKKRAELNQAKATLNEYEKSLKDVNGQLNTHSAQIKEWGDKLKAAGGKMSAVGDTLTTHVTAPIVAVGAAATVAWQEVDEAMDTVTTKTGASGEALEDMQQRVKNIAEAIPTDFQTAADAVGEVNTRFGLTGDALEELSSKFVKFAELNKTDVSSSVDNVQSIMAAWGVSTEDAGKLLDLLTKASQDTGVSVDSLSNLLMTNKTMLDEMGLSLADATMFLANMDKNGVDSTTALAGLKKALQNAAKEGKPMNQALSELQDVLSNSQDKTLAYQTAIELFGAKAGPAIADACMEGRLSFEELGLSLDSFAGTVDSTFNDTLDPLDQMKMSMNTLKDLGAEIVEAAAPMITTAMQVIRDMITSLKEKWDSLAPGTQQAIIKAAAIAAAIGPIISIGSRLISVIGMITSAASVLGPVIGLLASPVGIVIAIIGALIAAGVLLYQNWDTVCAWAGQLRDNVVAAWEELKSNVSELVNNLMTAVIETWEAIKSTVIDIVETVKETVSEKWEALKKAVTTAVETVRDNVIGAWETAKQGVSTAIETIRSTVVDTWETIKSTVTELVEGVRSAITGAFETARDTVVGVFQTIYDTIVGKLTDAWNFVTGIVSDIKNALSFDIQLPEIQLPEIQLPQIELPSVSSIFGGIFGGNKKKKSSTSSTRWNADAYDRAAYYTHPTVRADGLGFGDRQGGEFAVGESHLREVIRDETGNNQLIQLVGMILNRMSNRQPTNLTINQAPGEDIRELAREVAEIMNMDYDREEAVFG